MGQTSEPADFGVPLTNRQSTSTFSPPQKALCLRNRAKLAGSAVEERQMSPVPTPAELLSARLDPRLPPLPLGQILRHAATGRCLLRGSRSISATRTATSPPG